MFPEDFPPFSQERKSAPLDGRIVQCDGNPTSPPRTPFLREMNLIFPRPPLNSMPILFVFFSLTRPPFFFFFFHYVGLSPKEEMFFSRFDSGPFFFMTNTLGTDSTERSPLSLPRFTFSQGGKFLFSEMKLGSSF